MPSNSYLFSVLGGLVMMYSVTKVAIHLLSKDVTLVRLRSFQPASKVTMLASSMCKNSSGCTKSSSNSPGSPRNFASVTELALVKIVVFVVLTEAGQFFYYVIIPLVHCIMANSAIEHLEVLWHLNAVAKSYHI